MKKYCSHCGASMMEHRHNLSKAMIEGLRRLAQYTEPVNIKVLGLTRNQWDNFQKLRYWGLVAKGFNEEGVRLGGYWICTPSGRRFLSGQTSEPKCVWTYRGEFLRQEEDRVFVWDVTEGYRQHEDYAEDAIPHNV